MKCVQCKDDYKVKSNLVKIGRFWAEVYNLDDEFGYNMCKWCYNTLDERDYND